MLSEEVIYRPPREANSLLLPVTSGCSHNACTFCNMYRGVSFKLWPLNDIRIFLERFARSRPHADRIYLLGGDPFVLSAEKQHEILDAIYEYLPSIRTVTMYAQVANIKTKSDEELRSLRERGVNQLYIGLETGDDALLDRLCKGNTSAEAVEQLNRLTAAGITYGVIIMTGIAGKGKGIQNAIATAEVMNQIKARVLYCNSLVIQPDTPLGEQCHRGEFVEAGEYERIEELLALLKHLRPSSKLLFNSYHVSNALSINVELPEGQEQTIRRLEEFLEKTTPEQMEAVFRRQGMRI
jgi:radical SAM superfamily enzyme YgiQ (UPF0313 family)